MDGWTIKNKAIIIKFHLVVKHHDVTNVNDKSNATLKIRHKVRLHEFSLLYRHNGFSCFIILHFELLCVRFGSTGKRSNNER